GYCGATGRGGGGGGGGRGGEGPRRARRHPQALFPAGAPHGTLGARGGGLDLRADRAALPSQDAHLILSHRSLTPPPASDMEGDAAARPAMTEVLFYHLEHQPLQRGLPALVRRAMDRQWRAVI